jgi:rubrerythrin
MKEFNSIDDILEFAINSEQEAVDFYNQLAQNATNEDMKNVFEQFAREEMGHKAKLTNIKTTGMYSMPAENIADMQISDYLVAVKPTTNMTYQDALILAMKKEKAAFKLYSNLAQRAPSTDMKEILQGLAQEEAKHKLRFEVEYDDNVMREN